MQPFYENILKSIKSLNGSLKENGVLLIAFRHFQYTLPGMLIDIEY